MFNSSNVLSQLISKIIINCMFVDNYTSDLPSQLKTRLFGYRNATKTCINKHRDGRRVHCGMRVAGLRLDQAAVCGSMEILNRFARRSKHDTLNGDDVFSLLVGRR